MSLGDVRIRKSKCAMVQVCLEKFALCKSILGVTQQTWKQTFSERQGLGLCPQKQISACPWDSGVPGEKMNRSLSPGLNSPFYVQSWNGALRSSFPDAKLVSLSFRPSEL